MDTETEETREESTEETHSDPPAHRCCDHCSETRTKVDDLSSMVQTLAQTGEDSAPVKGPWTHRRFL